MDTFAGSEPRLFISFHLENEANGQPAQEAEEIMDTSSPNLARRERGDSTSSIEIEVIEITLSSPECTDVELTRPPVVSVKIEPEITESQLVAEIRRRRRFWSNSSTGSDECCGAYLTRKLGELEKAVPPEVSNETSSEVKQSESEPIILRPGCSSTAGVTVEPPRKHAPSGLTQTLSLAKFIGTTSGPGDKGNKPGESADFYEFTFAPAPEHKSVRSEGECRPNDPTSSGQIRHFVTETQSDSGTEVPMLSDHDSTRYARRHFVTETQSDSRTEVPILSDHDSTRYELSTLAEALAPPKVQNIPYDSGESDYESTVQVPIAAIREAPISISSRETIRKCFSKTNPISLPQGHLTVAFNQEQMCQVLKVVADETAKSTFGMMNSLIEKVVNLIWTRAPTLPIACIDPNLFNRRVLIQKLTVIHCVTGPRLNKVTFGTLITHASELPVERQRSTSQILQYQVAVEMTLGLLRKGKP